MWKPVLSISLGSALGALLRWGLGWSVEASWLAGIAMSTTSVAVVYAVMLEFGLNTTNCGKTVLAACFITDLATVVALGLIFAPFTWRPNTGRSFMCSLSHGRPTLAKRWKRRRWSRIRAAMPTTSRSR
jgi:predicted Kef-type K+ transport protein